jgi:hypothetical protein
MNRLEAAYAEYLEALRLEGQVSAWRFDVVKLRLADKTFLTPDFFVVLADGLCEFHETKGFMEEDANVKLKVAAELYPWFAFRLVTRKRKNDPWTIREIGG